MTSTIVPPIAWPGEHPIGATCVVEHVTPAMAEAWLQRNKKNRHLRPTLIEQYARDMAAGNWKLTAEAIKFDTDGNLSDGQHRLHAVVLAGKTVSMFVARGLSPEVQDVLDTGAKRTAADALTLRGHGSATGLAAAARLAIAWEEGEIRTSVQQQVRLVTHTETFRFVDEHPDLVEANALAGPLRVQVPPSVRAFTLWLTRAVDIDDATTFFSVLDEHRTKGSGDPLLALTRRLAAIRMSRERTSKITFSYYIIRTWNAFRKGEQLTNLKVANAHGAFAFPVPV